MEKISLNLTLAEAVKIQNAIRAGLDNVPSAEELERMVYVANRIFEPVRHAVCGDRPLAVTSFFRSPAVNRLVGGSSNSQHCKGEAMDLDADVYGNGGNRSIFEYIRDHLSFDQLIWEFGNDKEPAWVHVSVTSVGNRGQVLRSLRGEGGKTIYVQV
ncbi:MAG: peptidase M15 [Culturomica sp.]|nr:peptidase M15 [Culturomica sp.]